MLKFAFLGNLVLSSYVQEFVKALVSSLSKI